MAKLERTLTGDFDDILWRLDQAVLNGSMSATLEDRSDFSIGPVQVSVRMYERYSAMGAMFFKMNTWGEEAFLDTLAEVVNDL